MEQDIPAGDGTAAAAATGPTPETNGARRPRPVDRRLDPEIRRRIGGNLRVLYADLLAQPIPERFESLVAAFAARSGEETSR